MSKRAHSNTAKCCPIWCCALLNVSSGLRITTRSVPARPCDYSFSTISPLSSPPGDKLDRDMLPPTSFFQSFDMMADVVGIMVVITAGVYHASFAGQRSKIL